MQPYGGPQQQQQQYGGPPPKKGMSTLTIVLIVLGVLLVGGAGMCAIAAVVIEHKAKDFVSELGDGGLILVSPANVVADLAASKKDYVGAWRSGHGSALDIQSDGNLKWEKKEGGASTTLTAPIADFAGNDIQLKVMVTVTLNVSVAPHLVGDKYEMTMDGVSLHRPK